MAADALLNDGEKVPLAEDLEARAAQIQNENWKRASMMGVPTHNALPGSIPTDAMSTHTPPPVQDLTVHGQARVTVELDGKQLKEEMVPMVQEEIERAFNNRTNRSRANATDHGQVGGY